MMRTLMVLAALSAAVPALAADKAKQSAEKPKMVCKSTEPSTGSRMGSRKVCQTQAQWDAMREESFKYQDMRKRSDQVGS